MIFCAALILGTALFSSCASGGAQAEEYYSIGMSYYNLGKFTEAEKWLIRARSADRTMTASEYQLGRIAFENKRYTEAAKYFEGILKKDALNVLALEAAAFTRIKMGDSEEALKYYKTVIELVPENADDGFNYALLLFASEKYADSEAVIVKYNYNLPDNGELQLLLARVQAAQEKPESIDNYAQYLESNPAPLARTEYAKVLEKHEFYARAIAEYKKALEEVKTETAALKKADIRFETARLMFIAETDSAPAMTELEAAIAAGFEDIKKIDELLADTRLSTQLRDTIRTATSTVRAKAAAAQPSS